MWKREQVEECRRRAVAEADYGQIALCDTTLDLMAQRDQALKDAEADNTEAIRARAERDALRAQIERLRKAAKDWADIAYEKQADLDKEVDEWDDGNATALENCAREILLTLADTPQQEAVRECPTCKAPEPHLHPALQYEGEVQLCSDSWHWTKAAKPRRSPAAKRRHGTPASLRAVVARLDRHERALLVMAQSVEDALGQHSSEVRNLTEGESDIESVQELRERYCAHVWEEAGGASYEHHTERYERCRRCNAEQATETPREMG